MRTNDPIADFERYDSEQEEKLERLPRCSYCTEPIQQDTAVVVGNEWYCDDCLEYMRQSID